VTQLVFVRVQTDKSAKVTPELLAFPIYRRLHEGGEVLKKRDGREKKNGRKELVIVDVVVWGKTAGVESDDVSFVGECSVHLILCTCARYSGTFPWRLSC
jgi:hypothetical protein